MIRVTLVLADDPRKPYRVGQQRRLRETGRISVISVQALTLGDVTRAQARALGHVERRGAKNAVEIFQREWLAARDTAWLDREDRSEPAQAERFRQRWAWRDAVLVGYVVVGAPRLMARGAGDGHGYTSTRAMSIDPDAECVDKATQDEYSRKAEPVGEQLRARRLQTFAEDLAEAHAKREAKRRPMYRAA